MRIAEFIELLRCFPQDAVVIWYPDMTVVNDSDICIGTHQSYGKVQFFPLSQAVLPDWSKPDKAILRVKNDA